MGLLRNRWIRFVMRRIGTRSAGRFSWRGWRLLIPSYRKGFGSSSGVNAHSQAPENRIDLPFLGGIAGAEPSLEGHTPARPISMSDDEAAYQMLVDDDRLHYPSTVSPASAGEHPHTAGRRVYAQAEAGSTARGVVRHGGVAVPDARYRARPGHAGSGPHHHHNHTRHARN